MKDIEEFKGKTIDYRILVEDNPMLKEMEELRSSKLRGIECIFSSFKRSEESMRTLGALSCLRYLKLQQIDNSLLSEILSLTLNSLKHCEDIILESKSYFLTDYPRISLGLTASEERDDKMGFKIFQVL